MDSGTVGANDRNDLSGRERLRWGDNSKVYTRRNSRKNAQLDTSNYDSATTSSAGAGAGAQPTANSEPPTRSRPNAKDDPLSNEDGGTQRPSLQETLDAKDAAVDGTAGEEPTTSSPAKEDLGLNEIPLRSSDGETIDAKDGSFPEVQRQPSPSRSAGGPLSSGVVPLLEEDSPHKEAVSSGGDETASPIGQEDQEPLPEGQEPVPNGGKESSSGSGHEALLPNGGHNTLLNGGENLFSLPRDGSESLQNIREEPPVGCQPEVAMNEADRQTNTGQEGVKTAKGSEEQQLAVFTVPGNEGPHAPVIERPVNGAASTVLVNGLSKLVVTRVEDRLRINISVSRSKDEMMKLKRKLENELDQVRGTVEKLEAKVLQVTAYSASKLNSNSRYIGGSIGNFGAGYGQPQLVRANSELGAVWHQYRPQLARVNSEVGSVGYQETRPFRHLSVSVMENNHGGGEFVEKKRTPKANQFYRKSEFLLGKDRLPSESNKKLKLNCGGKKLGGNAEFGYGYGYQNRDKLFKSCSRLLQRLMKHKHAWVFNEPVDAMKLNIPDYHFIIKHPMDFGTIKSKLAQNWYKSAREFAEDVRLVFRNAMTYNPKGQDVHTMAEELSNIFEEKWMAIEKDYYPYQMYYDAGLPIPTPRKAPPLPVFTSVHTPILAPVSLPPVSLPPIRTLDKSESMTMPTDSRLKPSNSNLPHVGRTPVPKKPKAKDPNKRDMTYDEKQKLSTKLQSLPGEKLDAIVQIIKKRNSAVSQHDDEIEVDIDSVDTETLWELDRFVTNYKKSLSKNKRRAEIAQQKEAEASQAVLTTNPAPAVAEAQTESRTGDKVNPPVVEVEKQGDNVRGSSSSRSSSSDSGSSSSDSDSDSSSAYGSDAGHSPKA